MRVKVARTAGFCFGVRKALDLVLDASREREGREPLSTLGPLIHNNQALDALRVRGVKTVRELDEVEGASVVIRAHGAGPSIRERIAERKLTIIDATCPRVVRCQRAVERAAARGRQIVIAGDPDHAEVVALLDFADRFAGEGAIGAALVDSVELARAIELRAPVTLVAQTTFSSRKYAEIGQALSERLSAEGEGALEIVSSLCHSTEERQREVEELAREVDAVIVVGGRHSANTMRLTETAALAGRPVQHVETADELRADELRGLKVVGVTAGASTPAWVTESVVERLFEIGSLPSRLFRPVGRMLLGTNILLSAAAASLAYASVALVGMRADPRILAVAAAFVFFAYAANRSTADRREAMAANAHQMLFNKYRRPILAFGWMAAFAGTAVAFSLGTRAGLVYAGAVALAALYSIRLPRFRLRDIPGSKDVLIAAALVFVAVKLPILAEGSAPGLAGLAAGLLVFSLGFSAAMAVEMGDIPSDRLIGRESMSVLLGYQLARALIGALTALATALSLAAVALGWLPVEAIGLAAAGAGVLLAVMKPRSPGDSLAVGVAVQASLLASGPVAVLAAHLMKAS